MKTLITFLFCLVTYHMMAQDKESDFDLLLGGNQQVSQSVSSVEFKGLLKVYKNYFSDQILNDCIYEYSCSTFSQGAISEFGLIKGGFLSLDRLMRCNRASGLDFVPSYFNEKGEIKDHWSAYHKH